MKRILYISQSLVILFLLNACIDRPSKLSKVEEIFKNQFAIDEILLDVKGKPERFNTTVKDSSNYDLNYIINILTPSDTKFVNTREIFINDVLSNFNSYNEKLKSIVLIEIVSTGAKITIRYKLLFIGNDTTSLMNYSYDGTQFILMNKNKIENEKVFMALDSSLYINKAHLPNIYTKSLCVTVLTNDTIISEIDNKYYPRLFIE